LRVVVGTNLFDTFQTTLTWRGGRLRALVEGAQARPLARQ
jgi:hypothetical protein